MKKLLIGIILFAMMFNVCAAEVPEYMADLAKYNIMVGDPDGNLRLDETVTRAEMAKMIVTAMCLGEGLVKTDTVFEDVTEAYWASGYINAAYQMGIINGKSETVFDPEANVTYEEAVKMLVCATGYAEMAIANGGYPFGFMIIAGQRGFLEGLDVVATEDAVRGNIAAMVNNTLDIPLMFQVGFGANIVFQVMDGKNGNPLITLRTDLEELYGETDDVPRYSGEEFVGRVLQITDLEKTEDGYKFKNFLNEEDDATYVVNENTYVYLSENTVELNKIADGMYAQVWHLTKDAHEIEIFKIELMKDKPSGI